MIPLNTSENKMNWYDGSIADAIRTVSSAHLHFHILGTDETSKAVDQLFDADVNHDCEDFVALRLDASSEATAQFSAVYAVLTVPCVYLIAPNGRALDVKVGAMSKADLRLWIREKTNNNTTPSGEFILSGHRTSPSGCMTNFVQPSHLDSPHFCFKPYMFRRVITTRLHHDVL
ncbi:unnamed protein product [Echinostoma caproni]|uniref:Thioredoxin domain-containing protein n=1 Tax=Echinostoma caproni TaxID=27848 RepID=A0A3P8GU37_9TREM|nr:unnamed protein product [Echinostoma caproni]